MLRFAQHDIGLLARIATQSGSGEGDVYNEEEVRGWLQSTGSKQLERKPLAGLTSFIVAETAR